MSEDMSPAKGIGAVLAERQHLKFVYSRRPVICERPRGTLRHELLLLLYCTTLTPRRPKRQRSQAFSVHQTFQAI